MRRMSLSLSFVSLLSLVRSTVAGNEKRLHSWRVSTLLHSKSCFVKWLFRSQLFVTACCGYWVYPIFRTVLTMWIESSSMFALHDSMVIKHESLRGCGYDEIFVSYVSLFSPFPLEHIPWERAGIYVFHLFRPLLMPPQFCATLPEILNLEQHPVRYLLRGLFSTSIRKHG